MFERVCSLRIRVQEMTKKKLKTKDIAEKQFFSHNDIFADTFNELVLKETGLVIHEDELEDVRTRSEYEPSASDGVREQERDVAKFWRKGGVILSLLGLESQTRIDKYMPVRVLGYEGADYRYQLIQREDDARAAVREGDRELARAIRARKCYPVITAVLYYGIKPRWKKYRSLYDCLGMPEELKAVVQDRSINVIELAWLSQEQEDNLKTDLRLVVNMLRQMRITGTYRPKNLEDTRHVKDILMMFEALSGNMDKYTDAVLEYLAQHEGRRDVQVLDIVGAIRKGGLEDGRAEGLAEGLTQGLTQGLAQGVRKSLEFMKANGVSPEILEKFKAMYPDIKTES